MPPLRLVEREQTLVVAGEVQDRREVDLEELFRRPTARPDNRAATRHRWSERPQRSRPAVKSSMRRR